jgi:hypothetical protein
MITQYNYKHVSLWRRRANHILIVLADEGKVENLYTTQ